VIRRKLALVVGLISVALLAAAAVTYYFLAPRDAPGVIDASGQVRGTEVTISSKVSGVAAQIPVREGQMLRRGDLIARIASKEVEARLAQAQAQVAAAQSRLSELDAQLRSLDSGIEQARLGVGVTRDTSTHEVHRAREALERANAEERAVEAQWRQEKSSLERFSKLAAEGFVSRNFLDEAGARERTAQARLQAARKAGQEAQAALELAQAGSGQVAVKQKDVQRLQNEHERLLAARRTLGAQMQAAQARVAEVEAVLADSRLTAPADGTVINKLAEQGELIAPGRPIATLINLGDLYVRVFVPEREIGKLRLGNPARILADAFPDHHFTGNVSEIAQEAEFTPKEVHMKDERVKLVFGVKIHIDDPQGYLKPGMPVDVKIKWNDDASW
jgi:membrane fusion protein YbhG